MVVSNIYRRQGAIRMSVLSRLSQLSQHSIRVTGFSWDVCLKKVIHTEVNTSWNTCNSDSNLSDGHDESEKTGA